MRGSTIRRYLHEWSGMRTFGNKMILLLSMESMLSVWHREKVFLKERKQTTMITATLPVKGLNFAGCAREIEKSLSKLDGIAQVEASYVSQTVTVTYDETRLSETQLRELIKDCGFACGEPLTRFPGPSATVSQLAEAAGAH